MIIVNTNQEKLDSQSSEINQLKQELARLKSKLCPTCGQTLPNNFRAVHQGYSTTNGQPLW